MTLTSTNAAAVHQNRSHRKHQQQESQINIELSRRNHTDQSRDVDLMYSGEHRGREQRAAVEGAGLRTTPPPHLTGERLREEQLEKNPGTFHGL